MNYCCEPWKTRLLSFSEIKTTPLMYFGTQSESYCCLAIYIDMYLGGVKRINGLMADAVKNDQPLITKPAAVSKQV